MHRVPDLAPDPDVATVIDATGLACPMPVIELAKAIDEVDIGARVRLLATDPAAKVDVPVWCRMKRQRLRSADDEDGIWTFVVERAR
jgi:TusA-related sulfurtransferase